MIISRACVDIQMAQKNEVKDKVQLVYCSLLPLLYEIYAWWHWHYSYMCEMDGTVYIVEANFSLFHSTIRDNHVSTIRDIHVESTK